MGKPIKQILEDLSLTLDVEILYGDYPYAAYYGKTDYYKDHWAAWWFALEPKDGKDFVVFVPNNVPEEYALASTIHEMGHIVDERDNVSFNTRFDREVSAWISGITLMKTMNISVSHSVYVKDAEEGLCTYTDDTTALNEAIDIISKKYTDILK